MRDVRFPIGYFSGVTNPGGGVSPFMKGKFGQRRQSSMVGDFPRPRPMPPERRQFSSGAGAAAPQDTERPKSKWGVTNEGLINEGLA